MHKEGVTKAEFVKKLHERIRNHIQKGKREIVFNEGDWVWLLLRKDRFPIQSKSKLSYQGDGPFQVLKRINNNAYQLDLPKEYGVCATFNVIVLTPFACSTNDEAKTFDLRTNTLQEGGDSGKGFSSEPTTRAKARRIQEDWDSATDGKDTLLYMFEGVIT